MRIALAALAALLSAALAAAQPPAPPPNAGKEVPAPVPGGKVKLVPRDTMRAGPGTQQFRLPAGVRSLLDPGPRLDVPQQFDWSVDRKGARIELPLLGNNQYGNCFPVAWVHWIQVVYGNATGKRLTFGTADVVRWYLTLTGGRDVGTYDALILPELKRGIVPPGREHKALDYALVSPSDPDAVHLALWAFGPAAWTCSLLDSWERDIKPFTTWDASGRADPQAGHAMLLMADDGGKYTVATWGFTLYVTRKGLQVAQSEIISAFTLDWFDPATGYAPNGQHYTVLAPLWTSLTGHALPASPFPPPKPVDPPAPPLPAPPAPTPGGPYTLTLKAGDVVPAGVTITLTVPAGTVLPTPAPKAAEPTKQGAKAAAGEPLVIAESAPGLPASKTPTYPAPVSGGPWAWRNDRWEGEPVTIPAPAYRFTAGGGRPNGQCRPR